MVKPKINILLDLDQTVISAEPTEEYDVKKNKAKAKKFKLHNMDGYYVVFERPDLQPFLDFLFKNFNVSIWTAASKDYALFIVDKIILGKNKDRKLDYIFFSYHCDVSKDLKKGSKDLRMLCDIYNCPGYNMDNTVILDDYDEVHRTQPKNCIVALPFEFNHQNSHEDSFLTNLKSHLEELSKKVDAGESLPDAIEDINKKMKNNK